MEIGHIVLVCQYNGLILSYNLSTKILPAWRQLPQLFKLTNSGDAKTRFHELLMQSMITWQKIQQTLSNKDLDSTEQLGEGLSAPCLYVLILEWWLTHVWFMVIQSAWNTRCLVCYCPRSPCPHLYLSKGNYSYSYWNAIFIVHAPEPFRYVLLYSSIWGQKKRCCAAQIDWQEAAIPPRGSVKVILATEHNFVLCSDAGVFAEPNKEGWLDFILLYRGAFSFKSNSR